MYDKVKECGSDGVKGHEREWGGRRRGRGERTFNAGATATFIHFFEHESKEQTKCCFVCNGRERSKRKAVLYVLLNKMVHIHAKVVCGCANKAPSLSKTRNKEGRLIVSLSHKSDC